MPMFDCAFMRDLGLSLENFREMFSIKTKYGSMVAQAIPVVILAGVYISWPYLRRFWKGGNQGKTIVRSRSMALSALHGGRLALERLIDYHHARADQSTLDAAEIELKSHLSEEYPDYSKLQSIASKLEMSGKEVIAIEILERELEKAKEAQPQEAYEIGMLLTEMYIYKGEFDKALGCECLRHKEISDARRPLYKAIVYIMLGNHKEEALKCWEEFVGISAHFKSASESLNGEQLHKVITSFSEFEKVVNLLKADIYEAQKTVEK